MLTPYTLQMPKLIYGGENALAQMSGILKPVKKAAFFTLSLSTFRLLLNTRNLQHLFLKLVFHIGQLSFCRTAFFPAFALNLHHFV